MELVSSWLLQVVLIVLFAVVMDLIIPSSAMRNYVKLVMGLAIMVTMLKPISALYDNRFDLSRIQWPEAGVSAASLESIRAKAADLRDEQIRQAEQHFHSQVEKLVKEQVERAYPLEVTQVQARLSNMEPDRPPSIKELAVTVRPRNDTGSGGEIKPVEPVVVRLDGGDAADKKHSESANMESLSKQIQQELASRFEISVSAVSVQWSSD